MVVSRLYTHPSLIAVSRLQAKPLVMAVSHLWPITLREAKTRKLVIGECSDSEGSALPGASQPGSVSPVPSLPTWSEATVCSVTRSDAESEPNDETESDLSRRVQGVHCAMRQYWNQRWYANYGPKLLHHLSRLLFMKKRCA